MDSAPDGTENNKEKGGENIKTSQGSTIPNTDGANGFVVRKYVSLFPYTQDIFTVITQSIFHKTNTIDDTH